VTTSSSRGSGRDATSLRVAKDARANVSLSLSDDAIG
jgi:hypothetical protein